MNYTYCWVEFIYVYCRYGGGVALFLTVRGFKGFLIKSVFWQISVRIFLTKKVF